MEKDGSPSCLKELTIHDCPHVMVPCHVLASPTISQVSIRGVSTLPTMKMFPWGRFKIESSDNLRMLDDKFLSFLKQKDISEFYIRNCPNLFSLSFEGFNQLICLSKLVIDNCPNFLSSHILSDAGHQDYSTAKCLVLPSLKSLYIRTCGVAGKWISQALAHAQSMKKLCLSGCPQITLLSTNRSTEEKERSNLGAQLGCPVAASMSVLDKVLLQIPKKLCSSLKKLYIFDCPDLLFSGIKEGFVGFISLTKLKIRRCPKLLLSMVHEDGQMGERCLFPPSLHQLEIDHLPTQVQPLFLENMNFLVSLEIWDSPSLESLHLHSSCMALEVLCIRSCEQLVVLEGLQSLCSLEVLIISMDHELSTTWDHKLQEQEESSNQIHMLPPSLKQLQIWNHQDKIQSSLRSCAPSLSELKVWDSPHLMSLHLGCLTGLEDLEIGNCESLSSLEGLHFLKSLTTLEVFNCPVLLSRLEFVFPKPRGHELCFRLEYLQVDDSSTLSMSICEHLTSLRYLTLGSWHRKHHETVVSLTNEQERALQLLTSLEGLKIIHCPNLLSLPAELCSLPSLKELEIINCPGISRLPEKGLPPSLTWLLIDNCSKELEEQCRMAETKKLKVQICGKL